MMMTLNEEVNNSNNKPERYTLVLDTSFLKDVKAYAKRNGMNTSAFIRFCVLQVMRGGNIK